MEDAILPVICHSVPEASLQHISVQDVVAHVGLSTLHEFHEYVAFGDIKVVLQYRLLCNRPVLPIELVCDIPPELCGACIGIRLSANLMAITRDRPTQLRASEIGCNRIDASI